VDSRRLPALPAHWKSAPEERRLAWQPRLGTFAVLLVAGLVAAWLLSPYWASQYGQDSGVYQAAAAVASRGESPYDATILAREEVRRGGAAGASAGYAYPPLFTLAVRPLANLPGRFFWTLFAAAGLAGGLAGFEATRRALDIHHAGVVRAAFLVSPALALAVFLGNISPLLLLACGAGLLLMRRERPLPAGAALALVWVKPSVGLPVAAVTLLLGPGRRRLALAGFAAGSIGLLSLDLALTGPSRLAEWLRLVGGYAIDPGTASHNAAPLTESGLAGLPALFPFGAGAAEALTVLCLGLAAAAVGLSRAARERLRADPHLALALATSAALLAMPFAHLNDLVLGCLPMLVLATSRWSAASVLACLAWMVGPVVNLGLALALRPAPPGRAGVGVWLNILAGAALLVVVLRPAGRRDAG
jgi:hypothetical protein